MWGLDSRRQALMPRDSLVMHPGPMNRGVEISADVSESPRSIILDQVANGLAVRMSLLYLMLGGTSEFGGEAVEHASRRHPREKEVV